MAFADRVLIGVLQKPWKRPTTSSSQHGVCNTSSVFVADPFRFEDKNSDRFATAFQMLQDVAFPAQGAVERDAIDRISKTAVIACDLLLQFSSA